MLKFDLFKKLIIIIGRFSMDNTIKIICRVLHCGLGQSPKNSPPLLHQLRFLSGGILPDPNLQLRSLPKHHRQPRSSLHRLGHASPPTPPLSRPPTLQEDAHQQPPLRPKVQGQRSRVGQDRPRHPQQTSSCLVFLRRVVFRE